MSVRLDCTGLFLRRLSQTSRWLFLRDFHRQSPLSWAPLFLDCRQIHLRSETFLQATEGAPIPSRFVNDTVSVATCERKLQNTRMDVKGVHLTDATIKRPPSDASLEETRAAVAAESSVVLSTRSVAAHSARDIRINFPPRCFCTRCFFKCTVRFKKAKTGRLLTFTFHVVSRDVSV